MFTEHQDLEPAFTGGVVFDRVTTTGSTPVPTTGAQMDGLPVQTTAVNCTVVVTIYSIRTLRVRMELHGGVNAVILLLSSRPIPEDHN